MTREKVERAGRDWYQNFWVQSGSSSASTHRQPAGRESRASELSLLFPLREGWGGAPSVAVPSERVSVDGRQSFGVPLSVKLKSKKKVEDLLDGDPSYDRYRAA